MHWIPHGCMKPADTVSCLGFSSNGLLACTSWDGKLRIGSDSSGEELSASFSRPLFALAWCSSTLWFGGGERRICMADPESATVLDKHATEGAVLSLAATPAHVVAAMAHSLAVVDPRTSGVAAAFGTGASSVDIRNNYVCSAGVSKSFVHDLRNPSAAVHEHTMPAAAQLLQAKWLDSNAYAVSDSQSHVAVNFLNSPAESFVFQSNRAKGTQPRPIYGLARGPENTNTVVTGGGDGHLFVWDFVKRQLRTKVEFPLACTAIAYAPAGDAMAVGLSSDEWSPTPAKFAEPSRAKIMVSGL